VTLFEGLIIVNLLVSLWLVHKLGKVDTDVEILYQGVAGILDDEDKT